MNSRVRRTLLLALIVTASLVIPVLSSYATESFTYVYDDLNRLIRVDYADRHLQYSYDELGNREVQSVQAGICSYSPSSTGQSLYGPGGTGTTTLTADASCAWTASTDESWITITSGSSGSGNGSVGYTVAPNPGPVRSASPASC
jgi:YD repeat-containing protein